MNILKAKTALLIVGALTIHSSLVWAATCSVPSAAYPTIQSAVDDPTCSTIDVAPGVYPENVTIARSLTLNGAQVGQPVAGRTPAGSGESTVIGANPAGAHSVFAINAPSVTIDGFTIRNSVATDAAIGIQINANSRDAVVSNNIIDGIETLDATATGTAGIYLKSSSFGVNIANNDIRNVTSNRSATAILVGDPSSPVGSDVMYIHDNTISAVSSTMEGAHAVVVANASLTSNAFFFRYNHISNLTGGGWAHAIRIECDLVDAGVIDNDFSTLTSPTGNVVAVWFANATGNSAAVNANDFHLTEAAYGIKIETFDNSVGPMNGGCNWWGSPDGPGPVGPGHGARVSPGILYSMWRIVPGGDCMGSNTPATEDDCKNGGWITHVRRDGTIFKSQGDCVQYLNNGK